MRNDGNEHTSLQNIKVTDVTKTIIDRYLFGLDHIKDEKVLDYGCGCGHGAALYSAYGAEKVVGYDYNKGAIAEAKKNYSHIANLEFTDELAFHEGDVGVITSFEVFEHIPMQELKKTLDYFKSILKEGGKLIFSTPVYRGGLVRDPYHRNEMSQKQIVELMDEFFPNMWYMYSTIEHQDGIWFNTKIVNGVEENSRCFLIIAENYKETMG